MALVVEAWAMPTETEAVNNLFETKDDIRAISIFVRSSPHLLYLSSYSILALYWAQVCHSMNNQPFFHIRNIFLGANIVLYSCTFISYVFLCFGIASDKILFSVLALGFTATLFTLLYFFLRLIKLLPEQLVSIRAIQGRLYPVMMACTCGLLLGSVYYWCMVTDMLPADFSPDTNTSKPGASGLSSYLFDALSVFFIETLPSSIVIFFMKHTGGGASRGSGHSTASSTRQPRKSTSPGTIGTSYGTVVQEDPEANGGGSASGEQQGLHFNTPSW